MQNPSISQSPSGPRSQSDELYLKYIFFNEITSK